jgi:uncharacterized protein YciI
MAASPDDSSPPPVRQYVMVLYWRADPSSTTGDADEVFAGHMRYLNAQGALGRNLMSGPFGDDGDLRGISVYDTVDVDEVAAWVASDPAVVNGRFRAEVRPWWSTPGATLTP